MDQQDTNSQGFWPTEESFPGKINRWRDIEPSIYRIDGVKHTQNKYGHSAVLTLSTQTGRTFLVWAPKRLAEELMENPYCNFVHNKGLTKSETTGNNYFDFALCQQ